MSIFTKRLILPTKGMSKEEIKKRRIVIGAGFRFFMDEENLKINNELQKHLLNQLYTIFWTTENSEEGHVAEYLYDTYDFNNIGTPDKIIEGIILSAEISPKYKTERNWIIVFILVSIIALAYVKSHPSPPISINQSLELKNMVSEISKCKNISHMKIWADLKKLKQIRETGSTTSYKKFNEDQYIISKNWLEKQKLECGL